MSDFKRRIAIFLCMVMTLTTVFCMTPQQELQAASGKLTFNWSIGTRWEYNSSTAKYTEKKVQVGVAVGQEDLYIGDYVSATQYGKSYQYYGKLSMQKGVTYSTSNKNVIAVGSDGKLTVKKPGTATITVKFKGKSTKIKLKAAEKDLSHYNYNDNAAATEAAKKLVATYGTGITAENRYQLVNQIAKINAKNYSIYSSTLYITDEKVSYILRPFMGHASAIKDAVSQYLYNTVQNPLSTRSSKMFKISAIEGKGTNVTVTLKSKVTEDQVFALKYYTRKDYKSTIKKGSSAQFKIKIKGSGKTMTATATAKARSNKLTIKTKKLTKGQTYILQDVYYNDWLNPNHAGNKKISFKAK